MTATPEPARIHHGGNLLAAIARHGGETSQWLDLSTGINPEGYPVPALPGDAWRCLPQDEDGLGDIAARAYGAASALPVAGSQAAIRTLPALLEPGRVGVAALGYSEYAPAFALAGHHVEALPESAYAQDDLADRFDHLVVVNPNNPSGRCIGSARLHDWHARLARRGGTLIVDEAFMECLPALPGIGSLAPFADRPGLVVLRSIGKFYGLAGLRCGFVLAHPALRAALAQRLGHWTVSGPARAVARMALQDTAWQAAARRRLHVACARMDGLLKSVGLAPVTLPLFAWVPHARAAEMQERLARHRIWTRLFAVGDCHGLRLGLPPADEQAWDRLGAALKEACAALPDVAPRAAAPAAPPATPSAPACSTPSVCQAPYAS